MKTLSEILRGTAISWATFHKYRGMGLLPTPHIERKGFRGSHSSYPDETISLIHFIEIQKAKGLSLSQIRDLINRKEVEEKEAVTSEPNPDELTWGANILQQEEARLRQQGKELIRAELVKTKERLDGTVDIHLRIITVPREQQ